MKKKPNPEIDLNLKHYVGHHSDVIKDVKLNISNYLKNPDVSYVSRQIYSAIYNALTYYQYISVLSIADETSEKTFLEKIISEFNDDFQYLSKKYNSSDITLPRVIQAKGRVKSPISAFEKILEKISEYIHDGIDLSLLNSSLRDFIGLRIIIDPPSEIKAKGKQAESDFCYQVINDLLTHRGIIRQINNQTPQDTDYNFISVNTIHDPNKLKNLKLRPSRNGFKINPEEFGVFIPSTRPDFVEQYDEYMKDYRMYPKEKCYQRLHVCARPNFTKSVPKHVHPNYILCSKDFSPAIEYQFCTLDEEIFAEHGPSSHTDYKGDRKFHRLKIPLFMKFDENSNEIRLSRIDESIKEFYGYSFKDFFGIDYLDFLQLFDVNQKNNILAGISEISFNEENQEYSLVATKKPVFVDSNQSLLYIQNLLQKSSEEELHYFYEKNGLLDGTINPYNTSETSNPPIKIFFSVDSLELEDPFKKVIIHTDSECK